MASTISYYFICPVPFTNLGYHLSNLLPPVSLSEQVEREIDNTEQVIHFLSIHRPSLALNTSFYSKLTKRWKEECSVEESKDCYDLAKDLEHESMNLIKTIQSNLDNTTIHYGYCLFALIFLTLPFAHYTFSIQSPFSFLVLILYSLIIQPRLHPLIIAVISLLPSIRDTPKNTSLLILSLVLSLIRPSPSLTTLSTWILLLAPLFHSFSILSPLQVIMHHLLFLLSLLASVVSFNHLLYLLSCFSSFTISIRILYFVS